jgi:hypothetical protein
MSGDIIVGAAKHVHDWVDYWTVGATIAGAAILFAYTIAAFRQVSLTAKALRHAETSRGETAAAALRSDEATKKSNEIAEKALIYGKRSWLIPDVDESSPFKEGSIWKVAFYISNTGSVPGVMINAHARVGTDPWFETAPPQMFSPRGAIVLPGSGKEGALRVTADVPAGIPDEQLLAATGSDLSVYCAVTYKDVISDELETGERETRASWIHGHGRRWYNNPYFENTLK